MSLIEIIISIGILTVLASFSVQLSLNFFRNQQLDATSDKLTNYLRTAASESLREAGDVAHGVHLTASSFTLFRGNTYAARVTSYDESYTLPSYVTLSGPTDVIFAKYTAVPTPIGIYSLGNGVRTAQIIVNANGSITRQ